MSNRFGNLRIRVNWLSDPKNLILKLLRLNRDLLLNILLFQYKVGVWFLTSGLNRKWHDNSFISRFDFDLGFLCKICDRFFCSSEEAHLRHCSSVEHYDRVCRRVAPPRFEPPRIERYRPEAPFRREFIMASFENLNTLTASEIQENLTRRYFD